MTSDDTTKAEAGSGESSKPRKRGTRRRAGSAVQSDVLRASMADAISGSHINAGPDSTADLLKQITAEE